MDSSEIKSRKRKKHSAKNSPMNVSKKKKFSNNSDDSREFVKKKKYFAYENVRSKASSTTDIQNSNKYAKVKDSADVNMAKKFKKKKLKTKEIPNTKSEFSQPGNLQRKDLKKNKKFKKVTDANLQSTPSTSKKVSKVKKVKKKFGKSASNLGKNINTGSDDELSDFCISDDNGSDEDVLQEEIQNSSIFKQIEKLMKKAPHLNPANSSLDSHQDLSDEDVDNCSDLSLLVESGDEESARETDDQDASSSDSDLEHSHLKKETSNKKQNIAAERQDKNVLPAKKMSNFTENVAEITSFNRTPKGNALKRNISDKDKKSQMSSNLKNKVQEKLAGAKFRFLNEKLYTETGKEAFKYFQENTEEFEDYHSGYRLQVSKWPINPVNEIIADIQKLKKTLVIADLGCGEAKIAQAFPGRTIHSYDLVPLNEFVKGCDISKIPLPNESVDVAVFCLSLMGTNLKDYLCEAFRILKVGGILKIAEVESRIEDLGHFINYLKTIGFTLQRKNTKHKMFVFLDLKKENSKLGKVKSLSLKPCMYKKR